MWWGDRVVGENLGADVPLTFLGKEPFSRRGCGKGTGDCPCGPVSELLDRGFGFDAPAFDSSLGIRSF